MGLEKNPALIHTIQALLIGHFQEKRAVTFEAVVVSITRLLEAHRAEIVVENLDLAARTIVGAVEGLTNSGSMHIMSYRDLEAHLLRLQIAYLTMKN